MSLDNIPDTHFRQFGASLNNIITSYGDPEESFFDRQKDQVENLIAMETKFRKLLAKHPEGAAVYQDFVTYICEDRRNILDARPYFRERKEVFTEKIAPIMKMREGKSLFPFAANYRFIAFVLANRKWTGPIAVLGKKITKARNQLIELNMPLAITRARIFLKYARHMTFMDLIQTASEGLMSAIEKYQLPFGKTFVSTILGYIHGNLIAKSSETLLHFYPGDKRKLYRGNKFAAKVVGHVDYEKLATTINKEYSKETVTAAELADLLEASVCMTLDSPVMNEQEEGSVNSIVSSWAVAPESAQPDVQAEEAECFSSMADAIKKLSLFERKLLRLRGVELEGVSL